MAVDLLNFTKTTTTKSTTATLTTAKPNFKSKMATLTTKKFSHIAPISATNILPTAKSTTSNSTIATLTPDHKQKPNFFSLPGELRNDVYDLVLPMKKDIVLAGMQLGELMCQSAPAVVFATPRLFDEAGSRFFLGNTFWFEDRTLNHAALEVLETAARKHANNFTKIGIRRSYKIGDMKPTVIEFTVEMTNGHLKIVRPESEVMPFPGCPGYAKFKSPFTEPCRCQVRALAKRMSPLPGRRAACPDILDFIREYIDMVRTPGQDQYFSICKKCETVRRR